MASSSGLHTDRSHGIDNNRRGSTGEKKRGLYLIRGGKKETGIKRESGATRQDKGVVVQMLLRRTAWWTDGENC